MYPGSTSPQSLSSSCMVGRMAENQILGLSSCKAPSPRASTGLTCLNPANISPAVRNGLGNNLVAVREQTGASSLAATGPPERFGSSEPYFGCSLAPVLPELGLAFPSSALYYRDASVLPRDLLSGCNINLGNVPSARELYKVHSPRCMISLCREYPW